MIIKFCQIPDFLKKGNFIKPIIDHLDELLENEKYEEYAKEILEEIDVQFFAKNDKINNTTEFWNLIKTCDFFELPFVVNIFIFYLLNRENAQEFLLIKYMDLFNYNFKDIEQMHKKYLNLQDEYYDYYSISEYIKTNYNPVEQNIYKLFGEMDIKIITKKNILELFYNLLMEPAYFPRNPKLKFDDDILSLEKLFVELEVFAMTYESRKDIINELPLIPYKGEIMNNSYRDKYIFNYEINSYISIDIYINSIKITNIRIPDYRLIFLIIVALDNYRDIEYQDFYINFSYNEIKISDGVNKICIHDDEYKIGDFYLYGNIKSEFNKIKYELMEIYNLTEEYVAEYYIDSDNIYNRIGPP